MEIERQSQNDGGSETFVLGEVGSKEELGRGGFGWSNPNDCFVSRRHVSLELEPDEEDEEEGTSPSVSVRFEVIGRNPIWVFDHSTEEIQVFRRSEKGKLEDGDKFCLSSKRPVWLGLKRIKTKKSAVKSDRRLLEEEEEVGFGEKSVDDLELESVDISEIDPVKEFGFLVLGHEFDEFPNKMVCKPDNWNWFLEEPKGKSDDNDDDDGGEGSSYEKRKKSVGRLTRKRRRRRRSEEKDDEEEWRGESDEEEEDEAMIRKLRKVGGGGGANYSTRSKDPGVNNSCSSRNNKHDDVHNLHVNEDQDDHDETLGGFIVTDDDDDDDDVVVEEEEEEETEEEEEEEGIEEEEE